MSRTTTAVRSTTTISSTDTNTSPSTILKPNPPSSFSARKLPPLGGKSVPSTPSSRSAAGAGVKATSTTASRRTPSSRQVSDSASKGNTTARPSTRTVSGSSAGTSVGEPKKVEARAPLARSTNRVPSITTPSLRSSATPSKPSIRSIASPTKTSATPIKRKASFSSSTSSIRPPSTTLRPPSTTTRLPALTSTTGNSLKRPLPITGPEDNGEGKKVGAVSMTARRIPPPSGAARRTLNRPSVGEAEERKKVAPRRSTTTLSTATTPRKPSASTRQTPTTVRKMPPSTATTTNNVNLGSSIPVSKRSLPPLGATTLRANRTLPTSSSALVAKSKVAAKAPPPPPPPAPPSVPDIAMNDHEQEGDKSWETDHSVESRRTSLVPPSTAKEAFTTPQKLPSRTALSYLSPTSIADISSESIPTPPFAHLSPVPPTSLIKSRTNLLRSTGAMRQSRDSATLEDLVKMRKGMGLGGDEDESWLCDEGVSRDMRRDLDKGGSPWRDSMVMVHENSVEDESGSGREREEELEKEVEEIRKTMEEKERERAEREKSLEEEVERYRAESATLHTRVGKLERDVLHLEGDLKESRQASLTEGQGEMGEAILKLVQLEGDYKLNISAWREVEEGSRNEREALRLQREVLQVLMSTLEGR